MSDIIAQSQPLILVVDDQESGRDMVCTALAGQGWRVEARDSGLAALEFLSRHEPVVVLLDVQLPDLSGYGIAERIRANGRLQHIPIVFVTGVATEEEQVFEGYEHGAVDYLIKPVPPLVLRSKMRSLVELSTLYTSMRKDNERLAALYQQLLRYSGLDEPEAVELFDEEAQPRDRPLPAKTFEQRQMLSSAERLVQRTRHTIRRCSQLVAGLEARVVPFSRSEAQTLLGVPYDLVLSGFGDDLGLALRVIGRLLESTPMTLQELDAAVLRRDWSGARDLAHQLKNDVAPFKQDLLTKLLANLALADDAQFFAHWSEQGTVVRMGVVRLVAALQDLKAECLRRQNENAGD